MPSRYSFELQIKKVGERDFAYSPARCQEGEQNKTDRLDDLSSVDRNYFEKATDVATAEH
ncbi:MAG TPA: hypothetical protein VEM96_11710 [Pyrinomonadaceae bacterium]|nr:hypothetical protein [Pyrinomonadaceae bacterium]